MATFYPYVPDLAIAQVMFLAGVTVAVLGLRPWRPVPAGGGCRRPAAVVAARACGRRHRRRAGRHRTRPARHDHHPGAARRGERPAAPVHPGVQPTAIPVCLNPAYASYLPATAAALRPVLSQLAGLPGAPDRVSQAAAVYHQGAGNGVAIGRRAAAHRHAAGLPAAAARPADRAPPTAQQWAALLRIGAGSAIVASVTGAGPGGPRPRTRSRRRHAGGRGPAAPPPGSAPVSGRAPGAGGSARGYRSGGAKRSPGAGRARSVPRCRRWRPARPVMPPPSGSPRSRRVRTPG